MAGILSFAAVALGAFGAHAWEPTLAANGTTNTFELAVRYQFYHALALMAVGVWMRTNTSVLLPQAAGCVMAGVVCFSGSLYVLAFTRSITLWWATPLGGLFLLTGWLLVCVAAWKEWRS